MTQDRNWVTEQLANTPKEIFKSKLRDFIASNNVKIAKTNSKKFNRNGDIYYGDEEYYLTGDDFILYIEELLA